MDLKTEILKAVVPVLVSGGLAALSLAATYAFAKLGAFFSAKAAESKLFKALSALPHLVEAVYGDVHDALAPEISADAADGQFSPKELAQLREHALTALKASMASHGLPALKDAFGPLLDAVLGKAVDAAQAKVLSSSAALTSAPSPK